MAEIKSTREKVLERLAAMDAAAAPADLGREEKIKEGMRLAASYLRQEEADLKKKLSSSPNPEQPFLLLGMVRTLLRNIVLPREQLQRDEAEKALLGLTQIGGGDLKPVLQEMKAIVGRYLEHREELQDQLKAAFSQQMSQMEQSLAQQTGMKLKVDPAQHPKYQEEWLRLQDELNSQYGRALDQYKAMVEQRFTIR